MGNNTIIKYLWASVGGAIGWVVGEFSPTFPLISIAIIFILCDTYTAYDLAKRVKQRYQGQIPQDEVKFTSFAFGKVIRETIPKRLMLIILAFLVEHWVFPSENSHLTQIITGAICLEQFVSILENECSCRDGNDGLLWKILRKILVDKTQRHCNVNLEELIEENGKK